MKNKLNILYEDNHIIVVIKPFNLLSQKDNTNDDSLLDLLKDYIKEKYNKPGKVYLGLVHRLDRPTSGLMIFAKTSKAASRLSKQMQNREVTKKYFAVVKGTLKEKEGYLEDYILKESNNNSKISKDGKKAKLIYKVLEEKDNYSLIKINLLTGRHHQIRVQFSSRNHPIYGDQRYGQMDKKQIALAAGYLEFTHPVTKETMIFNYYPNYGKFKDFKKESYEK